MSQTTFITIFAVVNIVLIGLFFLAYRLFRSDPSPTVSDPLGVPRVARVSGVIGTLSDEKTSGSANRGKVSQPAVAAVASAGPVSPGVSEASPAGTTSTETVESSSTDDAGSSTAIVESTHEPEAMNAASGDTIVDAMSRTNAPDPLDLPGLFVIDTGLRARTGS